MQPRPRIVRLPGINPEREFDDPGLAALAAQGWTVAGHVQIVPEGADPMAPPQMALFLWPPSSASWLHLAGQVVWLLGGLVWLVAGVLALIEMGLR